MDDFFRKLGGTVYRRWKEQNFSLAAFSEIARTALEERPPSRHVSLEGMVRDFLLNDLQPAQTLSGFGQPEIVAYHDERFYIQLLFWMDGTTEVHQHEFSGAFHVMHGSSIQARYEFEKSRPVTPHLLTGDLRMKKIELLEKGSTVSIHSGRGCIHSLFHLDTPSVTVVVRTQHDPGTGPQFNYLPPHLAIDPEHEDRLTMRRKQLLDVLMETDEREWRRSIGKMLRTLDFERGFFILQHVMSRLKDCGGWDGALAIFSEKHGRLADGVGATLEENARRDAIKELRGTITDPEHRYFLALLMNVSARRDLLRLVAERVDRDAPERTILRWAGELAGVSDEGFLIADACFPFLSGISVEDQFEKLRPALDWFMKPDKNKRAALRELSEEMLGVWRAAFHASSLRILAGAA